MNLIDVTSQFKTDEECLAYLEKMRWPNRVRCAVCGSDKVSVIERKSETKNKRGKIYQCLEPTCKQQFSVTSGTIFHDSHLPLTKWFMAVAIIVDAKKSVSANQLKRHLGIGSYRTAWYLAHRIRKAMEESEGSLLTGTVEVDETYIGGKQKGMPGRQSEGTNVASNKKVVVGLRERGGALRLIHAPNSKANTLYKIIHDNVSEDADMIVTDDFTAYKYAMGPTLKPKHRTINHKAKMWVEGEVHTNTIENAFSLF